MLIIFIRTLNLRTLIVIRIVQTFTDDQTHTHNQVRQEIKNFKKYPNFVSNIPRFNRILKKV